MALSKAERKQLFERRRELHKEIHFLSTMSKNSSGLTKREKELKTEIEKINKKLAED